MTEQPLSPEEMDRAVEEILQTRGEGTGVVEGSGDWLDEWPEPLTEEERARWAHLLQDEPEPEPEESPRG